VDPVVCALDLDRDGRERSSLQYADSSHQQVAELHGVTQRGPLVGTQVVARERDGRIGLAVDIEPVIALRAGEYLLEIVKHRESPFHSWPRPDRLRMMTARDARVRR